jgi:hypothetical protein
MSQSREAYAETLEAGRRQQVRDVRAAEDLRIRHYRGTKVLYKFWMAALSNHFLTNSETGLQIRSPEQAETYWYMIGELYALKKPIPKADFITYWNGSDSARQPVYQANTVRVLVSNLIRTALLEEFNDRGTRKLQLSEKAKGMFEDTSDRLIISLSEMLHDFPNGLNLICAEAKNK